MTTGRRRSPARGRAGDNTEPDGGLLGAGPAIDAATAEQTTDYRRVGGYVLTDYGWRLEEQERG